MAKDTAWSYTRMKNFETCPLQYYEVNVLKKYPFKETPATKYGNEFHKAAENYVLKGTPMPERFAFATPMLEKLASKPGTKYGEKKMGITRDFKPCTFFAKDVWYRGIVDWLSVDGDTAYIIDYKTGKSAKYADPDQLHLMALAVFAHFPEVKRVRAGLLFVIADEFVPEKYEVDGGPEDMWSGWVSRYEALQQAHEDDVWSPKPSGLCRKHCPVLDCHHNGANG